MSTARANAARMVAASTNPPAAAPTLDAAMPATKNAPTPSCAMVSAAAFRTDMNGSSEADDRTTRTR
jgi:hypothetical protein